MARTAAGLLAEAHISVGDAQILSCCEYLLRALDANVAVNLTAIRDPEEALRLHVVDSLAALPEVRAAPAGLLCDVGSGGGFPGLPICLASKRSGALLDSARRKVDAVARVLSAMSIVAVQAVHARAEEYALGHMGAFSVVTARAVAELPILIEYAAPLLRLGGVFVALKGTPAQEERERGMAAAGLCGMQLRSARHLALPAGGEAREILAFEKTGESTIALPRGVGRAAKRPLA